YSNDGHVSAEMWASMPNGDWVEEGIADGVGSNPCNCLAYEQFWAEGYGGFFQFHWLANKTPDGVNHVYEIQNASGTNHWNIYLDWSYVAVATNQSYSTYSTAQAGLEFDEG